MFDLRQRIRLFKLARVIRFILFNVFPACVYRVGPPISESEFKDIGEPPSPKLQASVQKLAKMRKGEGPVWGGRIRYVERDGMRYVKKQFVGWLAAYEFFTEVKCLEELRGLSCAPSLIAADSAKRTIVVSVARGVRLDLIDYSSFADLSQYFSDIESACLGALNRIHSKGVYVNDINSTNLFVYQKEITFIDFGCSYFKGSISDFMFSDLKLRDKENMRIVLANERSKAKQQVAKRSHS